MWSKGWTMGLKIILVLVRGKVVINDTPYTTNSCISQRTRARCTFQFRGQRKIEGRSRKIVSPFDMVAPSVSRKMQIWVVRNKIRLTVSSLVQSQWQVEVSRRKLTFRYLSGSSTIFHDLYYIAYWIIWFKIPVVSAVSTVYSKNKRNS